MKTVHEVSDLTGLSVRTLHHYDQIGLLKPTAITEAGYRRYDDSALERLRYIMLYRVLEFPLKSIKDILDSPDFNQNQALEQQITLLTLKKQHLENLIQFAKGVQGVGMKYLDFKVFDTHVIDECADNVKTMWGKTEAYREYEQKTERMTEEEKQLQGEGLWTCIEAFVEVKHLPASDERVQGKVKELQEYITEHFYTCTGPILACLGRMYNGGGSMTDNINEHCGAGMADFIAEAVEIYCGR